MSNALAAVPNAIGDLPALSALALSGNQLKSLPAAIGRCSKLKTLQLSVNPLKSLPARDRRAWCAGSAGSARKPSDRASSRDR